MRAHAGWSGGGPEGESKAPVSPHALLMTHNTARDTLLTVMWSFSSLTCVTKNEVPSCLSRLCVLLWRKWAGVTAKVAAPPSMPCVATEEEYERTDEGMG